MPYLIDHHHLVRALHDEGVTHVLVNIIADLSRLKKQPFWTVMDSRNWLHPFDAEGKMCIRDRSWTCPSYALRSDRSMTAT